MQYEERIKNCLKAQNIVNPGAIFYSHYSVSGFGYPGKPFHYNICIDNISNDYACFRIHPCTSVKSQNAFVFVLSKDSTVRVGTGGNISSYCLLLVTRKILYKAIVERKQVEYKGKLTEGALKKFRREKEKAIRKQFSHKIQTGKP